MSAAGGVVETPSFVDIAKRKVLAPGRLTNKPESKSVSIAPPLQLGNPNPSDSNRSVDLQSGQVVEESKSMPGTDKLLAPPLATQRSLTNESEPFKRAVRSQAPSQGRNTVARNELISATGREFGPDIALKVRVNLVDDDIKGIIIKGIINENSSITEVLNILAFLLNEKTERNVSVIKDFSYDHDEIFDKLYASLNDKAPFNIKTLTPSEGSAGVASAGSIQTESITIPGTILKRDERYDLKEPITITSDQIQPLITACILQMVNILENTRQVFGGWAKLFKGMQGGSNSKSKTKTRRNNRRRH